MSDRRVLITDIAWPDISIEAAVLGPAGFAVSLAPAGDEETLVREAAGADAILTCFAQVTSRVIAASDRLSVVARTGVGLDNIDVVECERRGVAVTRVPDYCVDEVATHTVALALALWRRLPQYDRALRAGEWGTRPATLPLRRLTGTTVAILGMGRIGSAVADRLRGFGLRVGEDVTDADIVCVHLPLKPDTERFVDADLLAKVRPGAVLVNTGRGAVVDVEAVIDALDSGQLSGAGLDVFPTEPLEGDHPLRERDDVILTPHVAFYSEEALVELRQRAAQSVVDHFDGSDR
ncbi:C-terminal binding protein [Micromonospora sp. DR5-3]|uniref:C-terminal binding protein n=1 Tax=unclassified Micromonospora TaxID=2617518 RepID=UPI0011DB0F3A|nr:MULTISPECIES: C-terminal binding protein [unclassified Micromonospora]MCW3817946.1 C-terminal binding protein [Micromonospora sp. DR5-3]TYC21401.1 C-terminal binding protein [Micromonospora sp. MP36]